MSSRKPANHRGDGAGPISSPAATPAPSNLRAPAAPTPTDQLGRSLELLARVRSGAVPGLTLAPADRQALVSLLIADGLSTPEVAQILQVADRTIERDRKAIREGLALPRDPKLVEQMVGRLLAEAELSVRRIRRVARERDVEPATRIDAEHRCFEIVRDLVQGLQRLGYLPTATQKVEADLTHRVAELPSVEDLRAELNRLGQLPGADRRGLDEAAQLVGRAELASRVRDIVATQPSGGEDPATTDQEDRHDATT
jgi:transposase